MADEREVLLEVKDLEVTYGSGRKAYKAVKNANFTIYKGETFGLVGESGSGKTTIGRAIMRILPTSGGQVLYKGQQINGKISHALDRQVIKEIQMIFQDPQSSLNERAKVSYIVGEGLMNVRPPQAADPDFLRVQDAYLQAETAARGITDLADLTPVQPGLYVWQGDITTGIFHFPNQPAAQIAVKTVRDFLAGNTSVKKVIFNVFKDQDNEIYHRLLSR